MSYTEITIRVFAIILFSGLIGLDRELKHKPAGIKTHILVGLGSAVFTITSLYVFYEFKGQTQVDPGRIAAQIVTGIGFLGAGTIIQSGGSVRGLTTAASLWAVAGIGLAVGLGMYYLAALTTGCMLVVFIVINKFTGLVEQRVEDMEDNIQELEEKINLLKLKRKIAKKK
jgi:putative Mg2+ transporter-C (MgtC) family protein